MNLAELSTNATEFWFFGRLLFLSHVKHGRILANFTEFFQIFQKSTVSATSIFFCSARIFKH
jgi:hypothetical protein